MSIPQDALEPILQIFSARGAKLRYRSARLVSYSDLQEDFDAVVHT
ncbi:hypothetical protein P0R31_33980 [Bradyrhizobium yuanmingense]|nr:hypothetical protein [Bradyrhizobium yuanmingense]MDF0522252.1 hypothetical protein [Bradyrhizobium yuanmingense]